MGQYRHPSDLQKDLLHKISRNPITEPKHIGPRINERDMLDWNNKSVELQQLSNGIQYFIDIPKNELPMRLNIIGHSGHNNNHLFYINKNKDQSLTPQQLFQCISTLLQPQNNINSIRLYCCHLAKSNFAQIFANITRRPVKAPMDRVSLTSTKSKKHLNNRIILIKNPKMTIRVDNNRHHDIDVTRNRFIWFYPKGM
ncbi:hypothetical protein [Xenorhabdus bharatensis]|uniref:hypothetical protein n=1 Tax=Xenorhabdus bharatensis TaxID=3136256 RepID=UPI0030F3E9DA